MNVGSLFGEWELKRFPFQKKHSSFSGLSTYLYDTSVLSEVVAKLPDRLEMHHS